MGGRQSDVGGAGVAARRHAWDVQVARPAGVKRPKPLYACTAGQLGLHTTRGIPSLLDAMLPAGAHRSSRRYLKDLLLLPPPPHVAASIRSACTALRSERRRATVLQALNC